MAQVPPLNYKTFTIDALGFTEITAPIDCNSVVLWNLMGVTVTLRIDSTDSTTEKTLASDGQEVMTGLVKVTTFRWTRNSIICYAKAAAGSGSLHGSFMV